MYRSSFVLFYSLLWLAVVGLSACLLLLLVAATAASTATACFYCLLPLLLLAFFYHPITLYCTSSFRLDLTRLYARAVLCCAVFHAVQLHIVLIVFPQENELSLPDHFTTWASERVCLFLFNELTRPYGPPPSPFDSTRFPTVLCCGCGFTKYKYQNKQYKILLNTIISFSISFSYSLSLYLSLLVIHNLNKH